MRLDQDSHSILVVVPNDQLSLAIGKRGQNARLASRLIGWNIDIRSEQEGNEESTPAPEADVQGSQPEPDSQETGQ
jgi:N utilization substance protein A